MIYALLLLAAVAGALVNRFRGGGLFLLPGETVVPDHKRTQIRRLAYAGFCGLATWNPWVVLIVYGSLLTGWGYPVSTAIGAKSSPIEPEFYPFDKLAGMITNSPHLYGVIWLTIHGLFFGALTAFAVGSLWPLLWCSMGLCYKFAQDWERGELLYGAVQGFILILSLTSSF